MSEFFSWLPLSDRKTLPSVKVIYKDMDYAAGMFYPRCLFKYIDHDLDMDRGKSDIIVLSIHWGEPSGSTVAHEHRHFQQYYFLGLPKIGPSEYAEGDGTIETWKADIRKYYRTQPWEMDALLYENKMCPDESNDQQMEAVFS